MMRNASLLAHAPTANMLTLCSALESGFEQHGEGKVQLRRFAALQSDANAVLSGECVIVFCSENFGYMAGGMKDYFDRNFYSLEHLTDALPYALCVRAGKDGTGTVRALESICSALRWRKVADPLVLKGDYTSSFEQQAFTLGATLAASLANELF